MTAPSTTVVRGGTIVNADGRIEADVLIRDGRIVTVGTDLDVPADARTVAAGGLLVLPGGIDVHTHFDHGFYGSHSADDYASGGAAAAAGGITCHVDMAFQSPGGTLAEAVDEWEAKARGRALIDYAFHMVVVDPRPDVIAEMTEIVDRGITSFKLFMTYAGMALDDASMFALLRRCRELGALPLVHCENNDAIDAIAESLVADGHTQARWHGVSRPPAAEAEATARCLALASMAGAPVYIVHVSCEPALAALAAARARGADAYGETCPHYLVLDASAYDSDEFDEAARYVCAPPLRDRVHQDALWNGLGAGHLQGVHSDHIPYDIAVRRAAGSDDFRKIPNGVGSIQHLRPILWSRGVATGRLSAETFVALTATLPARLFGLAAKGRIAPGADADLVLWDPERAWLADAAHGLSRTDYVLYDGMTGNGAAVTTMRRGIVIWDDDGVHTDDPGRFVARERFRSL